MIETDIATGTLENGHETASNPIVAFVWPTHENCMMLMSLRFSPQTQRSFIKNVFFFVITTNFTLFLNC
jgi:hypothetical protein